MNQWIRDKGFDSWVFWAGIFYVFMAMLLVRSYGMFDWLSIVLITLLYLAFTFQYAKATMRPIELKLDETRMFHIGMGTIFFSTLWTLHNSHVVYAEKNAITPLFDWMRYLTPLVIGAAWFGSTRLKNQYSFRWIYAALLIWGLALKLLVIRVSPAPWIDVYTLLIEASDYFLAGFNPYPMAYVDIYGGIYDYPMGLNYPPGILFFLTPFRLLFEDTRVGYVFCDLVISLLIYRTLFLRTGKMLLSGMGALVFLFFPISFFMLEQAWIDPVIMLYLTILTLLLKNEKYLWSGFVLGLLCAVKQYVLFIPIMSVLYVWNKKDFKTAVQMGGICTGIYLIHIVPFLLNDFKSFYVHTFELYLTIKMRADALTIPAMLSRWDISYSGFFSVLTYLVIIGYAAFYLLRSKKVQIQHFLGSLVVIYGGVFIFGKQAFCGYYYLFSFMIYLLFIMTLISSYSLKHHEAE